LDKEFRFKEEDFERGRRGLEKEFNMLSFRNVPASSASSAVKVLALRSSARRKNGHPGIEYIIAGQGIASKI
jgi:hypothetical protein